MQDRHQVALDCLEIEKLGYSVLDFLKEQGAVSPWGTWWRLQVEELKREKYQVRDGKERKMAKKNFLTPEIRLEAERMIEAGEDTSQIKAFLGAHGSKNPSAHIYVIRKSMKKTEQAEAGERGPSPTCCQPARPSGVTVPNDLPEEEPPKHQLKIKEADGAVGTWRVRTYEGTLSFRMPAQKPNEDDQEIELSVEEWMILAAELPNAMKLFGLGGAGQ